MPSRMQVTEAMTLVSSVTQYDEAKLWLVALLYSTVRLQAALAIIPLFNKAVVPALLRSAIGVALSLVLVPPLRQTLDGVPETFTLVATVLKEGFLGLLIGYAVAVLFWAIEGVGFFIDNQRGASIASTLNPLTGNDTSPLGMLFNQAFIVFFLVSGGFLVFLGMLYDSYRLWPVISYFPTLDVGGVDVFADLFQRLVRSAVVLSSPAIVAMLLAEIGLALVSRFAPQLQVFFLAMPVKSAVAFLVLVVYLPTLFGYIHDEIGALASMLDVLGRGLR
ncbi:type III secretion system export apparatus subunit SctT [Rugamonas aquatica]|uniref:type III secretion system export apparatus subunit SctT n=1 Tax=Rugamonas aquatica TaxID=2743357 RepID=UPI001F477A5C|nr:type III secretion system export apparatus subunit SctT [Rugamonas aquatica]